MSTRDAVLQLILRHPKGLGYPALLSVTGMERIALDQALAGLVNDGKIRHTVTGYTAIDEAREAATYGSIAPAKVVANPPRRCPTCCERKRSSDFYPGLEECKSCYKARCNAGRLYARRTRMERLIDALKGISLSPAACECCERNRQIATEVLDDIGIQRG